MICEQCKAEGEKSNIYLDGQLSTCMAGTRYWDEKGRFHDHDPNTVTTSYHCSRGHRWQEKTQKPCLACESKG